MSEVPEYRIIAGYLCVMSDMCTCAPFDGFHDTSCGLSVIMSVSELHTLIDGDDPRHVIDLREDRWVVQHPLACRPHLFDCPVSGRSVVSSEGRGRFYCHLDAEGALVVDGPVSG